MEELFDGIQQEIRSEILLKAAAYADQSGNKQTAIWQATHDVLREAIAERREISDLIDRFKQNV